MKAFFLKGGVMKTLFALILFLNSAFAVEIPCARTYATPSQITILEKSFLVELDGIVLQTPCLYANGEGIFFTSIEIDERMPHPWQCQWDLTWNEGWRLSCQTCGRSKGSKPNE